VEPSLTILLPVHNAQSTVESMAIEVLDIAMEAEAPFEVVIIDDGSSDATAEVVHEVARRYPQIRVVSHGEQLGMAGAIETGLRHARSEKVFLPDVSHGISLNQLPRMWRSVDRGQCISEIHSPISAPVTRPGKAAVAPAGVSSLAAEVSPAKPSRPGRPNFLVRLRELALRE